MIKTKTAAATILGLLFWILNIWILILFETPRFRYSNFGFISLILVVFRPVPVLFSAFWTNPDKISYFFNILNSVQRFSRFSRITLVVKIIFKNEYFYLKNWGRFVRMSGPGKVKMKILTFWPAAPVGLHESWYSAIHFAFHHSSFIIHHLILTWSWEFSKNLLTKQNKLL